MKFLRNLFASILGGLIAFLILFFLFLFVVGSLNYKEAVTIKPHTILKLQLDAELRDFSPRSESALDEILGSNDKRIGLNEVLNAIENAKYDTNIEGISIELRNFSAGLSQLQTIRKKLEEFKDEGKFVTAYSDVYSQTSYYLSSVADSMYVNPAGSVDFKGLSAEILFFKELQEKSGVKFEVIRHGKYKSAVEPFLTDEMSDANREQTKAFLESLWESMLQEISNNRQISVENLNAIADNLEGRNASGAVASGLVDHQVYFDTYQNLLDSLNTNSKLNYVSVKDYISSGKGRTLSTSRDKIAVIYAQGEIIYGEGDEFEIGQGLIIEALKKAKKNSNVKGIVLRVNSPGGSALASELIWRQLELISEDLPIVVSMGDYAASGGYYLACNADYIFAEPTTITGSIGVYGTVLNLNEVSEKFGINAEQVHTNNSPFYSAFEPMTDDFRSVVRQGVEETYTTFLKRVADGRGMGVDEVDKIAQGRVWSGTEAKELGLVDALGTLENAIAYAAELAEISDYGIRNYPDYNRDIEKALEQIPMISTKEEVLKESFGVEGFKLYSTIQSVSKQEGVQMRLPYILRIK